MVKLDCMLCKKTFNGRRHANGSISKYCSMDCYSKCKPGPENFWDIADEKQKLDRLGRFFEKKVIRQNGCWNWKGSSNRGGYGLISVNGVNRVASRISWIIHRGKIPEGLFVLHTCDTPICTNPEHLFLGTSKDNATDRKNKGRNADQFGERNGSSVLSEEQVKEIRKLCDIGISLSEIANKFNIAKPTICDIKFKRNWRHI